MGETDCCLFVWGLKPSLLGRDGGQEQTRRDKKETGKKEPFIHLFISFFQNKTGNRKSLF